MKAALLKLHIAVFLWGFTGVLGKTIQLNEGLLVWYRLLITVVCLLSMLVFQKQLMLPTKKHILQLISIGVVVAIHWVLFYGSIKYGNVSIALICLSSAGFMTAFLEPLLLHRKIALAEVLLGLFAIVGIYLIFHFDGKFRTGIIWGVLAALASVIFSILNKKLVANVKPRIIMLYELSGGFIALTLAMPLYLQWMEQPFQMPSFYDAGWLLLLSVVCTLWAMDLSLQALQKVSAFTQNLTLNLEPVYGVLLAFAIYQENKDLSSSFYIGFAIILLSVILQTFWVVKKNRQYAH